MTVNQEDTKTLLGKLITLQTGLSPKNDLENFTICRDFALNKFKTHRFGRSSQFEVSQRLSGLEEKFRILDADALADALSARVTAIPDLSAGDIPEILTLLLELSDRPLEKTKLSDLEKCAPTPPPPELTWEEIIRDDPLEGEIWDDVDFGAESEEAWSGDDAAVMEVRGRVWEGEEEEEGVRKRRRRRGTQGSEEEYRVVGVEGFVVEADGRGLDGVKRSQYWRGRVGPKEEEVDVSLGGGKLDEQLWIITELQALREIIFMILGHKCALFRKGKDDDPDVVWIEESTAEKRFALRHTSLKGFVSVLEWFAEQGTVLNRIRCFTRVKEELPERQSFIAAIDTKLAELDKKLISIEEKFVGAGSGEPISLLALQSQLTPLLRPFTTLSEIVETVVTAPSSVSTHLEQLYGAACDLQAAGDFESFHFTAQIFFECLRTYLRPIRKWMEFGVLPPTPDFLITRSKSDEEVDPSTLWHSAYTLHRSAAPSFVQHVADSIFTTGKSVVFLKRLHPGTTEFDHPLTTATTITFAEVCTPASTLAPFSSLFALHFSRWIHTHHHSVSTRLRTHLLNNCGLTPSLHALDHIFLARNGYLFESLAQTLFLKLDRKHASWSDRFLLTEAIQSIFTGTPHILPSHLRMSVIKTPAFRASRSLREAKRSVNIFTQIDVDYRLPWPVANIIPPSDTAVYKRVFTFLLQIRRARYLLESLSLLRAPTPPVYTLLKLNLTWFANTIFAYLTSMVLRPQTELLRAAMERAGDVDAMVETHARFVDRIRDMCLLAPPLAPIHDAIISILDVVVKFAECQHNRHAALTGEGAFATSTQRRGERRRRGSESSSGDEELPSPSNVSETTGGGGGEQDGEEEEEEELDAEERYERELERLRGGFDGGVGFVRSGLRGVARAGVMPHLEMLAESLEGYRVGGWGEGS